MDARASVESADNEHAAAQCPTYLLLCSPHAARQARSQSYLAPRLVTHHVPAHGEQHCLRSVVALVDELTGVDSDLLMYPIGI